VGFGVYCFRAWGLGLVACAAEHIPWLCGAALEATQGQMDGFFSQIPYKCYLEEVASVGD